MNKRKPDLVVTGTGRCGTQWLTQCLKALEVTAVHECYYRPRTSAREPVPEKFYIEVSWMAALKIESIECPIVHLVRDPYKVAASLSRIVERPHKGGRQRKPMKQFNYAKDCTENAVARLIRMNRHIEPHAVARIRAEDGWKAVQVVLKHAGINVLPAMRIRTTVGRIPTNVNAGDTRPVRWPKHKIMDRLGDMAVKYGYERR